MRWSCRLKDTLYTEDFASEAFFVPEAESGWQQLTRDPALCEKLEFERKFGASIAEARLSAWTLSLEAPNGWQRAAMRMDLTELLDLRRSSEDARAIAKFRKGVAFLAEDAELWQAHDFQAFKGRAEAVVVSGPCHGQTGTYPEGMRDPYDGGEVSQAPGISSDRISGLEGIPVQSVGQATGGEQ